MEKFDINELNNLKANLYWQEDKEEENEFHFKLGDIELTLVKKDTYYNHILAQAGTIFMSHSPKNESEYSSFVRVKISIPYDSVMVFLCSEEEIARIEKKRDGDSYKAQFVLSPIFKRQRLQERLLR